MPGTPFEQVLFGVVIFGQATLIDVWLGEGDGPRVARDDHLS